MQRSALYVAAAIFTLATIAHLVRIYTGFQIVIGSHTVPQWVSYVGAPVAALLAIWMFSAARRA